MLKTKIKINSEVVSFRCPKCQMKDVVYVSMPTICYHCGTFYAVNFDMLVHDVDERAHYHRWQSTSDRVLTS